MIPLFFYDIIPFTTVAFTIALLTIVHMKTPKYMKNFKFYVFQNVMFCLFTELVLLICPCTFSHPSIILLPIGLTTHVHYNFILALCAFLACCYLANLDCSIAMLFERYFALSSSGVSSGKSKIAFYIWTFLISLDFVALLIGISFILIEPLANMFRNPGQSGLNFSPAFLAFGVTAFAILIFIRLTLLIIGCGLNVKFSKTLSNSNQHISVHVQKSNEALRRLIFIQFFGYFVILGFPFSVISYFYCFISEPSEIPSYCIFGIMGFGFYDVLFTAIFIKPYKKVMFYPFTWFQKTMLPRNHQNSHITVINGI